MGAKTDLDSILGRNSKGPSREVGLACLARILEDIDSRLDFQQSPRGWCYTLENKNIINKGEFDRAEEAINDCRKLGLLSIDFCAEDASRTWEGVEEPTGNPVDRLFREFAASIIDTPNHYTPDWWEDEKYYVQMFVEKVDLRKLFEPICKKYHIPIANSKGWSDLFQRAEMMNRFSAAEERGQECVLLYCGDFDPWGLKIGDTLKKNIAELTQATGYDPEDLKIDRFGLNYEFIIANDLTWIDNLTSSSGKDMSKSNYCYNCNRQYDEDVLRCSGCRKKLYIQPDFVRDYVKTYGARKCEANALVVVPQQGRDLAEETILKYLGLDSISRFEAKSKTVKAEFEKYMTKYPTLFNQLSKQTDILKREEEVEATAEEDDNSGS